MALMIWPVQGVELVGWSPSKDLPHADRYYATQRPLYFVNYFYGVHPTAPYNFTITLKVRPLCAPTPVGRWPKSVPTLFRVTFQPHAIHESFMERKTIDTWRYVHDRLSATVGAFWCASILGWCFFPCFFLHFTGPTGAQWQTGGWDSGDQPHSSRHWKDDDGVCWRPQEIPGLDVRPRLDSYLFPLVFLTGSNYHVPLLLGLFHLSVATHASGLHFASVGTGQRFPENGTFLTYLACSSPFWTSNNNFWLHFTFSVSTPSLCFAKSACQILFGLHCVPIFVTLSPF